MLSRRVTSFLIDIVSKNSRNPWTIERCRFHVTNMARRKKKNKVGEPVLKIIKPRNCDDGLKPTCEPCCKNVLVIGGSEGFGFAAADYLLCKGARNIMIADNDREQGLETAEKLCNSYGKGRAEFVECDIRNLSQFQAGLQQACNKLAKIDILFNNFDKEIFPSKCSDKKENENNYTARIIRAGLKILGKNHGGSGGIIINCASIFGFLGWPQDPFPIYCRKEPVIEVTMDFAKENKVEETGVRLVALCPTNKLFSEIGLPPDPEPIPNKKTCDLPQCIPTAKHQIGPAISYILAWAQNGSTWLVEPAISVHKVPRLIHFPTKEGEKIDPKLYGIQFQNCPVELKSSCVDTSNTSKSTKDQTCNTETTSKKK